jgi:hypothetical protein
VCRDRIVPARASFCCFHVHALGMARSSTSVHVYGSVVDVSIYDGWKYGKGMDRAARVWASRHLRMRFKVQVRPIPLEPNPN